MAKELLKEAIADAKAVREVALQNAKMALEEAFDSKIKNMLSAKLAEELEEDVSLEKEYIEEKEDSDNVDDVSAATESVKDDGVDEEINLDELMAELDEVSDEDTMSEDNVYEDEDPFAKLEDALDERKKPSDDEVNESVVAALVGVPALIASVGGIQVVMDKLENPEFAAKYPKLKAFVDVMQKIGSAAGSARRSEGVEENNVEENNVEENINIDALIAEIEAEAEAETANEGKGEEKEKVDNNISEITKERDEAIATVTSLKESISEMNLLNSKLLYCNKLFKANQLTEAQKVKVIDALDLATTTNEAKLVFNTLQESFNFTGVEKRAIREGLGRASKASGNAPKKVIAESVDGTISRFQKLANIKF
jgi:hypothetical protein